MGSGGVRGGSGRAAGRRWQGVHKADGGGVERQQEGLKPGDGLERSSEGTGRVVPEGRRSGVRGVG